MITTFPASLKEISNMVRSGRRIGSGGRGGSSDASGGGRTVEGGEGGGLGTREIGAGGG